LGPGFATAAVKAVTEYAFATFDLRRLQATVFEWNPASARVLEKAGYTFEGRQRGSIVKDGRIGDALMYARLRH
jgi:ribosomal-protein-alanine N-acetyltransferase